MRAVSQDTLGGPEVLHEVERDVPAPGPTEVQVRVRAAGINPVDWKTRATGGMGMMGDPPFVLGWDVSGEVTALGVGVTRFRVGDEVYGMPWFAREAAAYAEYVTAPSRQFAPKPAGLSHVEAGALPLAGLTAWQALVDTADVRPGQRVLVTAAAGGVGHLAVQIAKARGAYVLGTARAAKHDFLRSLGVDEPIDYTTTDVAGAAGELDLVFDLIGGDQTTALLPAVRRGGLMIPVPGGVTPELATAADAAGVRTTGILVEPDHAGLESLTELVESGRLRVEVAATFPLAEAARAHEMGEAGRTQGKIVLIP